MIYPYTKTALRVTIPAKTGSYNQTIPLYTQVFSDYAEIYELCKIITIPEITLTNTGSSYPKITFSTQPNIGTGNDQTRNDLLFAWYFYPTNRAIDTTVVDYTDGRGNGMLIGSNSLCCNVRIEANNTQPLAGVTFLLFGRTKRISLAEYNSLMED